MIPHGAPTTWFSASWHSAARRSGSMAPAPSARAVATSSAALDATPTDAGRSDEIIEPPAVRTITPWRTSTRATPIDVVRPAGQLRQCRSDHPRTASWPTEPARRSTGRRDRRPGRRDRRPPRVRRLAGRHLEHERARVVRHATEEVEAARRATPHRSPSTSSASTGDDARRQRLVGVADPGHRRGRCPAGRPAGGPRGR